MAYTTVKLPKELKERLEDYAKPRGLTLAGAIDRLLECATLSEELREIRELLREQNELLRRILAELRRRESVSVGERGEVEEMEEVGEELPSFVRDNPWLAVLGRRASNGGALLRLTGGRCPDPLPPFPPRVYVLISLRVSAVEHNEGENGVEVLAGSVGRDKTVHGDTEG